MINEILDLILIAVMIANMYMMRKDFKLYTAFMEEVNSLIRLLDENSNINKEN